MYLCFNVTVFLCCLGQCVYVIYLQLCSLVQHILYVLRCSVFVFFGAVYLCSLLLCICVFDAQCIYVLSAVYLCTSGTVYTILCSVFILIGGHICVHQ